MTIPALPDTGSAQVPWPTSRRGSQQTVGSDNGKAKVVDPSRKHMSTLDLVKLSISMAGAQVAWTVELGCVATSSEPADALTLRAAMERRSCSR